MGLPEQRIRILAGTPIEVGEQRLLPSVLVNTITMDQPASLNFVSLSCAQHLLLLHLQTILSGLRYLTRLWIL